MIDISEQVKLFKEFFEQEYKAEILSKESKGEKYLDIDFRKLAKFSPGLADSILDTPEDSLKAATSAIEEKDSFQVMFSNLPNSTEISISEISSPENIGKFLTFRGYITKPSEMLLKCRQARWECPVCLNIIVTLMMGNKFKEPSKCLPKGTKVWTPQGLKNIEAANEVLCIDYNGEITKSNAKIVNSGMQQVWKINDYVECSGDHLWFVLRKGKCRFLPTKHLNKGDLLYVYNVEDLCVLREKVLSRSKNIQKDRQKKRNSNKVFGKDNLLKRMFSKTYVKLFERGRKEGSKYQRNYKTLYRRKDVYEGYSLFDREKQKVGFYTNKKRKYQDKNFKRANYNGNKSREVENAFRQGERQLQAWKEMWRTILSQDCKRSQQSQMSFLSKIRRIISPSQGWRSFKPRIDEPYPYMPFLPYKVSRISKIPKKVEMIDLQVLDYNNFILENCIITHNCGCGRKGKFMLLSKKMTKFQRLEVQEAFKDVPDKPRRPVKKKILIENWLTRKELRNELQPGQMVKVHGFIELEQLSLKHMKGLSNEFNANRIANNIIPVEHSWESVYISSSDKNKILEMAKKPNLLDEFAQSLAPSFEGYVMLRKTLILQHVGGKRIFDENGNIEERECIHILLVSAPGRGKTALSKKSIKISPLWHWTTGAGLTRAGLVACISKDDYGNFTLEAGPLVMADKGILAIDEMEKMNPDDYGMLNNAMVDEETKITKANIDQLLKTRTSILSTANPTHKKFVPEEPAHTQLAPIPKDILDRFDVIWPMREDVDQDKLEDKYMARHLQSEGIKQIYSNEDMRQYIAYSKRLIPVICPEAAKHFKKKFAKLTGKSKDDNEKSHRLRGNILRWAYAHSKFHGVGKERKDNQITLNKADIDFAFSVIRYSFEMLDLLSEQGFAKFEDIEEIPKPKEVNRYYLVRDCLKKLFEEGKRKPVSEFDLLKIIQQVEKEFSYDELMSEIVKLQRAGDIFEPKRGYWSVI